MTLRHAKKFEAYGYNLEKFGYGDTRRIGPDRNYKYYAAKDGQITKKFEDSAEAGQWIEAKNDLNDIRRF